MDIRLPKYNARISKDRGVAQIYDTIRKKYVRLTPEEWVRQHFINYLSKHLGYPQNLISVEQEIDINGLLRRFDILCYNRELKPLLIVECKSPFIRLSQMVFDQAFEYNSIIMAQYLVITNGVDHICGTQFGNKFKLTEIPNFEIAVTNEE